MEKKVNIETENKEQSSKQGIPMYKKLWRGNYRILPVAIVLWILGHFLLLRQNVNLSPSVYLLFLIPFALGVWYGRKS